MVTVGGGGMVHSVLSKVTTLHATDSVHQFVYYIEARFTQANGGGLRTIS